MRSRILVFVFSFCAIGLMGTPLLGQDEVTSNQAKVDDIRRLLVLTGSGEIGLQMMDQMITSFKTTMPQIPEEFWEDFRNEADMDDLINMTIPIYDKYLTHDDIKELIQFYESPVGKKFISVMPQIMQESFMTGQQWGAELGRKVAERLQEKGYR